MFGILISVKLVFRQCGFKPTFDDLFDEDRALRANILSRPELPVEELIQNFDNLRSLKLNSECGKDYVRWELKSFKRKR